MTESLDWITRAGAKAKGKRPAYFDDPALDRMLSMLTALVGEVSVLRERLDTIERLLEAQGTISRADVEAYSPDAQAGLERGVATRAYIARILRGVQPDMEALQDGDRPVEEVIETLRDS